MEMSKEEGGQERRPESQAEVRSLWDLEAEVTSERVDPDSQHDPKAVKQGERRVPGCPQLPGGE